MKNYYQVLGIKPTASMQEIKEAYKQLSKRVHPDVNWGESIFEEIFKEVNEAHQVLTNDNSRAEYNQRYNHFFFQNNFLAAREEAITRNVYSDHRPFKRKIFINGSICVGLLFVFVILNAMFFDSNESTLLAAGNAVSMEPITTKKAAAIFEAAPARPVAAITETKPVLRLIKVEKVAPHKITIEEKPSLVVQPPLEAAKPEQTRWTDQEMQHIVNLVNKEKAKINTKMVYVKLVQSANSNVANAFDIAHLLQQNHFSIAGRQTTSKDVKGILVSGSNNCITVTIGRII